MSAVRWEKQRPRRRESGQPCAVPRGLRSTGGPSRARGPECSQAGTTLAGAGPGPPARVHVPCPQRPSWAEGEKGKGQSEDRPEQQRESCLRSGRPRPPRPGLSEPPPAANPSLLLSSRKRSRRRARPCPPQPLRCSPSPRRLKPPTSLQDAVSSSGFLALQRVFPGSFPGSVCAPRFWARPHRCLQDRTVTLACGSWGLSSGFRGSLEQKNGPRALPSSAQRILCFETWE